MQRITGDDVVEDLFGAGKDGFTDGEPGLSAATVVTPEWLNQVQEDIVGLIETCGQTPDATPQMYAAIKGHNWNFTATIKSSNSTGFAATTGDVRAAANFEYCDSSGVSIKPTRSIQIPIMSCMRTGATVPHGVIAGDNFVTAISSPAFGDGWLYDVVLPLGAELVSVRTGVIQLFDGATVGMKFDVYESIKDDNMSGDPTLTLLGSHDPAGLTAGARVLTLSSSAYTQTTLNSLAIDVSTSDSGTATDSVHWIRVSFKDPGPRNF